MDNNERLAEINRLQVQQIVVRNRDVCDVEIIKQLVEVVKNQEVRIQQLENYKGVCIGNGIWPVDTGSKMKDV